ncbi:hypothetical protein [Aliivibrio sifiae]|uniref:Uncharacterized protein n=1 Tax=Aliivibrio sifiae TaxID=566293 RepID=A0A2S7X7V2_9GAMM|nr:hypothetical protein [Aliivibrio sifiae]PQJ87448.1 hypothetical protein BTO23_15150 [Aliivibrio sifiae]GLR77262.1 hypothetical protein GCM10007855_41370 [Aliivibrio sifiae]
MNLRKGITSVEFWHEFDENQINAINSNVSIISNELIVGCDLKPVDSNQKYDAEYIFSEPEKVIKIIITDELICTTLINYMRNHRDEFNTVIFIVGFGRNKFKYQVSIKKHEFGGLKFIVQA